MDPDKYHPEEGLEEVGFGEGRGGRVISGPAAARLAHGLPTGALPPLEAELPSEQPQGLLPHIEQDPPPLTEDL